MSKPESIMIDDVKYIRADLVKLTADDLHGMPYKIVRCKSSGVFSGYVESRNGREVVIRKARRLWYWAGAATLSQLAMEGTKKPDECRFPCEVDRVKVLDAIELLDVSAAAKKSLDGVKIWKHSGPGDGDVSGSGNGSGSGSGYGSGDCSGDGSGHSDGSGSGSGNFDGYGYGSGYGSGTGYCSGYGYDSRYDYGYGS